MSFRFEHDAQLLKQRLAALENEKAQLQLQLHSTQQHFLEHICLSFENLDEAVCLLDADLKLVFFTQKFLLNIRAPQLHQGILLSDTNLPAQFGNLAEISRRLLLDSHPKKLQWDAHIVEWNRRFRISIGRLSTPASFTSVYMVLRITDITHCKEAEIERNYLKTELQCLFEHLPMGLAIVDSSGRYVKINHMLASQNGKTIEEHIGKNLFEILPDFLAGPQDMLIKQVLNTSTPVLDLQVTGTPQDDKEEHTYLCNYVPVFIEDLMEDYSPKEELLELHRSGWMANSKKVYGVVIAVVDITHFKNKEQLLIQENTRVHQGNMSKTRFLATVSHELRTPLTCILGMVDCLLEDSELSNEQLDCVQSINRSAHSMLQVLNDVLDMTKVEAGKLVLDRKKFDLLLEIEMATDVLSFRAAQKNLELILKFDFSLPRFFIGDPGRIRQMLMNVAGNGIKFTESGHVMIEVLPGSAATHKGRKKSLEDRFFRTVSAEDTSNNSLLCNNKVTIIIRVTDSGIGIPTSKQCELFEEFKQIETSQAGTGLGLAISRQLAHLMDGDVYLVSSVPGMGSVFEIMLSLDLSPSPFSLQSSSSSLGESSITQSALDKPQQQTTILKSPSVSPTIVKKELHTSYSFLSDTPEDFQGLLSLHQSRNTFVSTILICKHEKWRSILQYYLEYWKCFVVDCVEDHNLALEKMKFSKNPDLIITDCCTIEEYESMQRVLPDQTASIWIVPPSGRSMMTQLSKKFEGTRSRYITRPILPSSLMDCLFGLLTNRKLQLKRNFSEASTTHKTFPNIRVLVVEDNLLNQKIILRMLHKLGCEADVAENGKEAIDKWRSRRYDIIFMDCQMPIMNGWDATRAIRAMEKSHGSHTPIVALTARALSTDRATSLESGMDEFLSKPLQQDKVEEILSQFCDMRPVKRRKSMDVQE
eukprot:CAMPEP_0168548526 /NCGR_PEP_ID=MMETSP0413-20121227/4608_1 /TAXON_ID=136452 /ORGANISM="Filamoeba nolandi, Strain NC-AS-23-1" /LENGTH=928 /DNA_ID=CAMNT_0008578835 /DNA_START=268 /DNA_END=3054 /DNA_ORIENTATION=+